MKTIATAATVAAESAPPDQDNTQESQNPSQSASPSGVRICWNNCSTTIHQMQQQQQDTMFGSARAESLQWDEVIPGKHMQKRLRAKKQINNGQDLRCVHMFVLFFRTTPLTEQTSSHEIKKIVCTESHMFRRSALYRGGEKTCPRLPPLA